MITAEDLARQLNGREYGAEITREEEREAKASGLVVVFGASDDLIEFKGAINDEIGANDGVTVYLDATKQDILSNDCEQDDCPHYEKLKSTAPTVTQAWDVDGYSWVCHTDIPHHSFDIMEDQDKYCKGLVFAVKDIPLNNVEDDDKLRWRLSEILTDTANALKGTPDPLSLHSWHDLPEKAQALQSEIESMRRDFQSLRVQLIDGKVFTQEMKPEGHWTNIIAKYASEA